MGELGPVHVTTLARAVGLTITDDDLTDVTFRLAATLDHLVALDALDLLRDQLEGGDRAEAGVGEKRGTTGVARRNRTGRRGARAGAGTARRANPKRASSATRGEH